MKPLEDNLFVALRDFARWLELYVGRVTLIGGLVAVYLGRPCMTRDLDAVFGIRGNSR